MAAHGDGYRGTGQTRVVGAMRRLLRAAGRNDARTPHRSRCNQRVVRARDRLTAIAHCSRGTIDSCRAPRSAPPSVNSAWTSPHSFGRPPAWHAVPPTAIAAMPAIEKCESGARRRNSTSPVCPASPATGTTEHCVPCSSRSSTTAGTAADGESRSDSRLRYGPQCCDRRRRHSSFRCRRVRAVCAVAGTTISKY